MNGLDHKSYEKYYTDILVPEMRDYRRKYSNVEIIGNAEEKIWESYVQFNTHCKNTYMKDKNKLLDNHKVVASYMYAVLRVSPMINVDAFKAGTDFMLNEELALCFGVSLLRALEFARIEELPAKFWKTVKVKKDELKSLLEDSVHFPITNHGKYKKNLLAQLYHTKMEHSYNVLALAETLYLLEIFTLVKYGFPETILSGDYELVKRARKEKIDFEKKVLKRDIADTESDEESSDDSNKSEINTKTKK